MKNFYLKKIIEMLNDADERITRLAYLFLRGLVGETNQSRQGRASSP